LTIRLNGEPHELSGPTSITALLDGLGLDARRVAVEHNFVVIKRDAYGSTMVREGDEVEIVNFVGGGEAPNCSHAL
jgi:thiamine biosynthesis protein ThiS